MRVKLHQVGLAVLLCLCVPRASAAAADELCDPSYQDCRAPLLALINNERVGIDASWWFMEDTRYSTAIINRWRAGVPVRIIIDTDANAGNAYNRDILTTLRNAGIPMREKTSGGILHWKMMLFAGQGQVEFSGANFTSDAFVYNQPYVNYIDELIYFTTDPPIVNSFQTKFDDVWTSTSGYSNYGNITLPLTRSYPTYPISAEMNFPPGPDFASRSVGRYNAETTQIDAIMYRITDRRHTDALIAAMERNVRVRLITEPLQYRDATRLWHSWNVDRLYMAMQSAQARNLAGGAIKHRAHPGLSHEKMTMLYSQTMSIFGSSNWTGPSANSQLEHNIFTRRPWMFLYGVEHFNRKWNNRCDSVLVCDPLQYPAGNVETQNFVPLPPDRPAYVSPTNSASGQPTTLTLRWYAGPWAHKYDIYVGTEPGSTVPVVADVELGPSLSTTDYKTYTLTVPLAEGTQYYWRVVSKTMANVPASGPTWSFVTTGAAEVSLGTGDVNLYASKAPLIRGNWSRVADAGAAGGYRMSNPNVGAAKISSASATPADYFEMTFNAVSGIPYHLWIRGKAASNNYNNDSVFVQFSASESQPGTPTWRIGSTSAASVSVEECSGCGLAEWGWSDNSYGGHGVPVYFSVTGPVTVRVQVREDGLSIDQIMLSPVKFLSTPPGTPKFDVTIYPEALGGTAPPPPPTEPPPTTPPPPASDASGTLVSHPGVASVRMGAWTTVADSSAAGGQALVLPNTSRAKVATPVAEPAEYAEVTLNVEAGRAYRLWLRGKATSNNYANDSVFVQFSGAVDAGGNPIYRIGTTGAADVNLEDCGGCGVNGWGWQDNGWGVNVFGPVVYFAESGTQTIRIQNREDGLFIDQLMLSPDAYLDTRPGALKSDATIYPQTVTP